MVGPKPTRYNGAGVGSTEASIRLPSPRLTSARCAGSVVSGTRCVPPALTGGRSAQGRAIRTMRDASVNRAPNALPQKVMSSLNRERWALGT